MPEHDWNAWNEGLERGLERFAELVGEDPELEREFVRSQQAFLPAGSGPQRVLAERRHLEWFVCERPSDRLEGVPGDVLREAWLERTELEGQALGAQDVELLDAMLGSLASAFEIAALELDGSLLLRDLFGLGEYEIVEPAAAGELAFGDLLVGRIFPVEGELHRLSPAMGCFRDRVLTSALREDVERMRAGRGRVLRMQQSELEVLFFPSGALARDGSPRGTPTGRPATDVDAAQAARSTLTALASAGLDEQSAAGAVDTLLELARTAPDRVGVVTELLNTLAFETEVDLEVARRTLGELWALATHELRPAPRARRPARTADDPPASSAAAEALRRFDEGRARGEDLEQLFRQLEQELGVADEEDEDADQSPDFPGVVGAMLAEYLWDREREHGVAESGAHLLLRELSRYAEGIGVFENFGARELLDFSARWLLDESSVQDEEQARELLVALADFCRWAEERHAHELWSAFEAHWRALTDAVPRLAPLRSTLAAGAAPDPDAYRVGGIEAGRATLLADDGRERAVALEESLLARLRPGDLVRIATRPEGTLVCRVYPGVLQELIARRREPAG